MWRQGLHMSIKHEKVKLVKIINNKFKWVLRGEKTGTQITDDNWAKVEKGKGKTFTLFGARRSKISVWRKCSFSHWIINVAKRNTQTALKTIFSLLNVNADESKFSLSNKHNLVPHCCTTHQLYWWNGCLSGRFSSLHIVRHEDSRSTEG